ncbi:uncharacterized protein LOC129589505 [Paramacrobiotus metropolitanus]|uniref:uncharacterized protein LOC129589505 n=1 Tax=Paramacrobiotus metropolitanus TaxID=2943436 RepID=UPI002445D640|nr:uncharacterized protein LOC129589505 [Paramacrobiotus metropolitanus]
MLTVTLLHQPSSASSLVYFCAVILHAGAFHTPPMVYLLDNVYKWDLPVTTPVGTTISQLRVNRDYYQSNPGSVVVYSISADKPEYSDLFFVDPQKGTVMLKKPLDSQNSTEFVVSAEASDERLKVRIQVPVHIVPNDNSTARLSTVDDPSIGLSPFSLSQLRPCHVRRAKTGETVVWAFGACLWPTDRTPDRDTFHTNSSGTSTAPTSSTASTSTTIGTVAAGGDEGERADARRRFSRRLFKAVQLYL